MRPKGEFLCTLLPLRKMIISLCNRCLFKPFCRIYKYILNEVFPPNFLLSVRTFLKSSALFLRRALRRLCWLFYERSSIVVLDMDILSWWHKSCCGLKTDPFGPTAHAERLASIVSHSSCGGAQTSEESDHTEGSAHTAKIDDPVIDIDNHSATTMHDRFQLKRGGLMSPPIKNRSTQDCLPPRQAAYMISKTEKQLRTVLYRIVHRLDLLDLEGTTHDLPSIHNITINPRTGAVSLVSTGPQYNVIDLMNTGDFSATWAPELCLQFLYANQASDIDKDVRSNRNMQTIFSYDDDRIVLSVACTWAIGILVCDLLGVELPWHEVHNSKSLPDFIVKWCVDHAEESLGSLSRLGSDLQDKLKSAISPSLSNVVFECLWISTERRPSIREIKLHPFFNRANVNRTIRGNWVPMPILRSSQYRSHLSGINTNWPEKSSDALKSAVCELDIMRGLGYSDQMSCVSSSQRIVQPSAKSVERDMLNVSATDCDGQNKSNLKENPVPTIFSMGLTCCSPEYTQSKDYFGSRASTTSLEGLLLSPQIKKRIVSSMHRVATVQQSATSFELKNDLATMLSDSDKETDLFQRKSGDDMQSGISLKPSRGESINRVDAAKVLANPHSGLDPKPLGSKVDKRLKRLIAQIIVAEGSPAQLRGSVWSLLLSISPSIAKGRYTGCIRRAKRIAATNFKFKEEKSMKAARHLLRQLDKDIPRCHSYHALLKTHPYPQALKNVLLAWTLADTSRMYWQGLDSICAPLILLYKGNESLTFASLEGLISIFLNDIFVMNNHLALQERLLGLQHLVSFLDPKLSNHLKEIGVTPNLYAISWFLTLFAHVIPIDLVLEVWDVFLGLAHISSTYSDGRKCACGIPVLFAAILLSKLGDFILSEDFAATTVFLSRLPCALAEIVQDVLHTLPLVFRVVPRSLLRLNDPSDKHYISNDKPANFNMNACRAKHVEETKYERSPRISLHEVLSGPIFDRSLIIDVRSEVEFAQEHLLGSVNIPFSGNRDQGCRTVKAQRTQIGSLYVIVVGADADSAGIFAGCLVDREVSMVMSVGSSAKMLFKEADSSIVVRKNNAAQHKGEDRSD